MERFGRNVKRREYLDWIALRLPARWLQGTQWPTMRYEPLEKERKVISFEDWVETVQNNIPAQIEDVDWKKFPFTVLEDSEARWEEPEEPELRSLI